MDASILDRTGIEDLKDENMSKWLVVESKEESDKFFSSVIGKQLEDMKYITSYKKDTARGMIIMCKICKKKEAEKECMHKGKVMAKVQVFDKTY